MKTINVEDETWETLALLKIKKKTSSFDELLRYLIANQKEE
jgi:predicted CopG family antitoxin